MTVVNTTEPAVSIGIDAAVVADHQIAIRGPGVRDDFRVPPTLAGMTKLTERLRAHAGALVVVEPTAGTWLPLTMAVTNAGCRIGFVQNRDSAKLRSAISGRNKTDAIPAPFPSNGYRGMLPASSGLLDRVEFSSRGPGSTDDFLWILV